jgi:thiamine biosynthesis lipoprotein
MGGRAHLVVHGGSERLLDMAEVRLRELEARWSRFVHDSDITRANQAAGTAVAVSADTIAVLERALEGWRQTGGRFDVTVLPALVSNGYTHSAVSAEPAPAVPGATVGMSAWVMVDAASSRVAVPPTSAIDLGGIGKGFAADLVADELVDAGAAGALVNVGGDLALRGLPCDDTSWCIGIEDPAAPPSHVAVLRMGGGGVATSGTTIRRWTVPGDPPGTSRHHLIDPMTARPARTGSLTATVLAGDCATAEVYATAAMLLDARDGTEMLEEAGLAGLIVGADAAVHRTHTLQPFLV